MVVDLEDRAPASRRSESFSERSKRVEHGCQAAVEQAIEGHLAMGRPIYFRDPQGRLIKRMPDGRCFEIRFARDGEEVVVQQLSSE
jgi:hypothetical protein